MATGVELGNARILHPGLLRWLRALGWMILLTVLAILTFRIAADAAMRLASLASGTPFTTRAAAPPEIRLTGIVAASVAMLGVYGLMVRFGEKRPPRELALAPLVPEILGGLAIGGVLMAAIIGALAAAGMATIQAAPVTHVLEALKETVQSSVLEETLLRLVIFRLLWRAFGVWPALGLAALLFGALHLGNPGATPFSAACLIAGEGVGAGLYMLTGRPWLSIGMHAGWNFTQGWIFGSVVSGVDDFAGGPLLTRPVEGLAPYLNGGGFGPESTLFALIVSLIASIACLWLAGSRGAFRPASEPRRDPVEQDVQA